MSNDDVYLWAADCPNCGEKDEEGEYKGARLNDTRWGHEYSCCSDKCGKEFYHSDKHKKLVITNIEHQMAGLEHYLSKVKTWSK